jgi:uncharacterized membrane protein YhaH (DUF805 family)
MKHYILFFCIFLLCTGTAQAEDYVATGEAYFYEGPSETTRRNAYLVAGDKVASTTEKDGFIWVEFTNQQTQRTTRGWLKLQDLEVADAEQVDAEESDEKIELRTEHIESLNKILRNTPYYANRTQILSFIEKNYGGKAHYTTWYDTDMDIECNSEQDYSYVIRGKYLFVTSRSEEYTGGARPFVGSSMYIVDIELLSEVSKSEIFRDLNPALKRAFKKLIVESLQYLINTGEYDKDDVNYDEHIGDDRLLNFDIEPGKDDSVVLRWDKYHPNYRVTIDVPLSCAEVKRFLTDKGKEIFCNESDTEALLEEDAAYTQEETSIKENAEHKGEQNSDIILWIVVVALILLVIFLVIPEKRKRANKISASIDKMEATKNVVNMEETDNIVEIEEEENTDECESSSLRPSPVMFKDCFSINGRIGRREYWLSFLVILVVGCAPFCAPFLTNKNYFELSFGTHIIPYLLMQWFSLVIFRKRCHDIGKSGWYYLLLLIPFIGFVAACHVGFSKGDQQYNKYDRAVPKGVLFQKILFCIFIAISIACCANFY